MRSMEVVFPSQWCVSVLLASCVGVGAGVGVGVDVGAGVGVGAEPVAVVEVLVQQDVGGILQGHVIQGSLDTPPKKDPRDPDLQGDLRLIRDEDEGEVKGDDDDEDEGGDQKNPWIGVVPVELEESSTVSNGNQESFTAAVVSKMKRALVLGASALIILVLNQNTVREMDLSQVLSKPVIIIQTSDNVTKLFGVLLRGLQATAKITYKTFLQNNLGATLTLWSSCGRSRGGVYGEWQGVICTGETNSPVQNHNIYSYLVLVLWNICYCVLKYLQQLWNTVVLVALILSTGVIVHARWQHHDQFNDELQLRPKPDLLKRLSALKTRTFQQPRTRTRTDPTHTPPETESCAVCLEQYNNNQCLRVLPCSHEFHRDCVDPWLQLQQTCPLCKRSVLSNFC